MRETFTYPTAPIVSNLTLPISPGYNYTTTVLSDFGRFQNAEVARTDMNSKIAGAYRPPAMETLYRSQDLEATFAKLAKSITNNIRQTSDNDDHTVITGKGGKYVVLIRIRAWFLIPPAVLIFGGGVFLVVVLHYNRKSGIDFWGTNTLPIVHLGGKMEPIFDDDDDDMKLSTMEQKAKQHLVQFSAFQLSRRDFDRVHTSGRSENHEMISPSRISADVVVGGGIVSPLRTSVIVQSPSPDALSVASDYV